VGFILHCLFYFPENFLNLLIYSGPQVIQNRKAPDSKRWVITDLAHRGMPHGAQNLSVFAQLRPGGAIHAPKPDTPRNNVGDQIRQLNACRQIAMYEKRFRNNQR